MGYRFEVNRDSSGEWYWELLNGVDTIAKSGGRYEAHADAISSIETFQTEASEAPIQETQHPRFEIDRDDSGEWCWKMISSDDQTIATCYGTYLSQVGAKASIRDDREAAPLAEMDF
jgi:uncharacterized protein YegP (UPF0339 family)